jgi:hypothetical protein
MFPVLDTNLCALLLATSSLTYWKKYSLMLFAHQDTIYCCIMQAREFLVMTLKVLFLIYWPPNIHKQRYLWLKSHLFHYQKNICFQGHQKSSQSQNFICSIDRAYAVRNNWLWNWSFLIIYVAFILIFCPSTTSVFPV